MEEKSNKIAIIVRNPSFDNLLFAINYASVSVASGLSTNMLFVGWAAEKLVDGKLNVVDVPLGYEGRKSWFEKRLKETGYNEIYKMLKEVKETGNLKIYICSSTSKIWEIPEKELAPEVDGVIGLTQFLLEEVMKAKKCIVL